MAGKTLTGPVLFTPAQNSASRSTSALATVGSMGWAEDAEYVYVKAVDAIVSGSAVSASGGLSAVKIGDLDTGAFIGISEVPFASGEYGYIVHRGLTTAIVESGAVAGDSLQLSATATKLKKTTSSGDQVAIALAASDNAGAAQIAIYIV